MSQDYSVYWAYGIRPWDPLNTKDKYIKNRTQSRSGTGSTCTFTSQITSGWFVVYLVVCRAGALDECCIRFIIALIIGGVPLREIQWLLLPVLRFLFARGQMAVACVWFHSNMYMQPGKKKIYIYIAYSSLWYILSRPRITLMPPSYFCLSPSAFSFPGVFDNMRHLHSVLLVIQLCYYTCLQLGKEEGNARDLILSRAEDLPTLARESK